MIEYDKEIQDWRTEAKEQLEAADTLPGVFGEIQKAKALAEIEMNAIHLQAELQEGSDP